MPKLSLNQTFIKTIIATSVTACSFNAIADDFVNHYGAYIVNTEGKTTTLFVVPSYLHQKYPNASTILYKKNPTHSKFGTIVNQKDGSLKINILRGYKTRRTICPNARLAYGNNRFDNCRGESFQGYITNSSLKKVVNADDMELLQVWTNGISASSFVGSFSIAPASVDLGETDTRISFTQSDRDFLKAKIQTPHKTFYGSAIPAGENEILILYKNNADETHGAFCKSLSPRRKVKHLVCSGTLQGKKLPSNNETFRVLR